MLDVINEDSWSDVLAFVKFFSRLACSLGSSKPEMLLIRLLCGRCTLDLFTTSTSVSGDSVGLFLRQRHAQSSFAFSKFVAL